MRTHHGIKVDENWDLADDEESTAHWKRYAELHIQLFPYVWSLANQAVNDGTPLWIPYFPLWIPYFPLWDALVRLPWLVV